jgi:predicted NBD/HSP70 family sugar kinase
MAIRGISVLDLKAQNQARILDYVRTHPGCTRPEIADEIRLTRAAVSKLIGAAEGEERASAASKGAGLGYALDSSGQRPAQYALKGHLGIVLSLDIGANHIRVRAADLMGRVLEPIPDRVKMPTVDDPTKTLEEAARLLQAMLADIHLYEPASGDGLRGERIDITVDSIAGLAIGVPFPVTRDGEVLGPGDWGAVQLPTSLWDHLPNWNIATVIAYSDVNLGAWAELEAALDPRSGIRGLEPDTATLVYVKWSSALNGAIVAGEPLLGHGGLAAQFLHAEPPTGAPEDYVTCDECGQQCVAANASLNAMIARAGRERSDFGMDAEERAPKFVAWAKTEPKAQHVLEESSEHLGEVLGLVLNTLNPRLLVIGGAFQAETYHEVGRYVSAGLRRTTLPAVFEQVIVGPGRRTGSAAVEGGLGRALHEFATPYVLGKQPDRAESAGRRLR